MAESLSVKWDLATELEKTSGVLPRPVAAAHVRELVEGTIDGVIEGIKLGIKGVVVCELPVSTQLSSTTE